MSKSEIIKDLTKYIDWIDSLQTLSEQQANAPYQEGKWSPKEILMHMAEWDRFTVEERLPEMQEGNVLKNVPFEPFNKEAARLANEKTFEEIRNYAKEQRERILKQLQLVDETDWIKEFKIGNHSMSIKQYFADFVWHDSHHKEQIESVRKDEEIYLES
ncbi:DinB family protein [Sporosarcina thermotolerans]|uniref:DinB family protein n=1 Tax=Sporosarcina thermotolerans TaxID=633404 RepID=A0AAW9AB36_9BACL|nr:DinB family protein [Sporosarcina thermotolerans]MDW0118707.1 DinB family protein [Sporosarcina thermotolerans]WHT48648.1 DinB family protein [Sporosarcina thermotolerans]